MTKKILFILSCFIVPATIFGQQKIVDSLITQEMNRLHIAGAEYCFIEQGNIKAISYYGYQNLEKRIPVTNKTLFDVASTTKTITGAAIMQLYSKGKFKLDDDINKYLDFKVLNPYYPTMPITLRQLLRHRSSIADNNDYLGQFWDTNNGDASISLGAFLKDYLSKNGKHYDKTKNFYQYKPDSKAAYCNIGIALIGYIVERISGLHFDEYCNKYLFQPLSMDHTSWFLRNIDTANLAMPYQYSDSLHQYQPLGYGGFPDYPAGALHTNVAEFSSFLLAWINNGNLNDRQIIDSSSIQLLTPSEINLGFYLWFLYATDKGKLLYIHTGKGNGISSFIAFSPKSKNGIIFLCNGDIETTDDWKKIINTLYDYAL